MPGGRRGNQDAEDDGRRPYYQRDRGYGQQSRGSFSREEGRDGSWRTPSGRTDMYTDFHSTHGHDYRLAKTKRKRGTFYGNGVVDSKIRSIKLD